MPVKFVERRTPSSAWRREAPSVLACEAATGCVNFRLSAAINLALKRATPDECVRGYMSLNASGLIAEILLLRRKVSLAGAHLKVFLESGDFNRAVAAVSVEIRLQRLFEGQRPGGHASSAPRPRGR